MPEPACRGRCSEAPLQGWRGAPALLGVGRRHRQEMPRVRQGRDGGHLGMAAVAEVDDPAIIEPVDPASKKRLNLISACRLAGYADRPESLPALHLRTSLPVGV